VHASIWTCMSRRMVTLVAALVLIGAIISPVLGAEDKASQPTKSKAARKPPEPAYDRITAKQAYEEALRAFNLGHWQDAVAGFEKSYTLSGDAALLFNVAQAQRQAGNAKEAVIAYKAYLREKPDTPHREMIEAKVKELEAGAETKTAAAKPADSKPERDNLAGIWEAPFDAQKSPTAEPHSEASVAAVTVTAGPTLRQTVPEATSAPPASVVVPAPPIAQEPSGLHANPLNLSQPATQNASTGSSSRWWLWTGIGAVVAAGIVTAVILSTRGPERDISCPSGVNGCLPVGK
jgi:hypothetical protein